MSKMTVFHGSISKFTQPSLEKCKHYRDFGIGFYVTENFYDALDILKFKPGYVYEYELNMTTGLTKEFLNDEELLEYIIKNRIEIFEDEYDFIMGGTLSNCSKIFKGFRNKGIDIDKDFLLKELSTSPYGNQICVKTEDGLERLNLIKIHSYSENDFE